MIERFQKIKNIGTFKDAHLPSFAFNRITLIYGGNSQGKSTLCDIIKSLCKNVPEYIEKRKTVGATNDTQVEISFGNKKKAVFSSGAWEVSPNTPETQNIEIFDSEFVEQNVFTNSTIDRKNKEEFTKFILGSESIEIEKKLVDLNSQKLDTENKGKEIEKWLLPLTGMPINNLLAIDYKSNIHDEDCACLALEQNIKNLKKDLYNIKEIQSLSRPNIIKFSHNVVETYQNINKILSTSYSFSQDDIITRFNEHKNKFNTSSSDMDKWVSKGRQIQKNNLCPYCGNGTDNNVLVESYLTLFCEKFVNFTNKVDELQAIRLPINVFTNTKLYLNANAVKVEKIAEKVYAKGVDEIVQKLGLLEKKLKDRMDDCDELLKHLNDDFANKIDNKKSNKYIAESEIDTSEIVKYFSEIGSLLIEYNTILDEFNGLADTYFIALSEESIKLKILEFENELKCLTAIVNRHQYNDKLLEYQYTVEDSKAHLLKAQILKSEFDISQARFLETFFADIDQYYKRLGSRNYKIDKETNGRGTNKVYTLKLFYRDVEVESNSIKYVLSDSDKRALALAIFLAKLKHNPDLGNTIIVMDDPITSFDKERMTLFINILKEFETANQIIILTHYKEFYKKIVELMYDEQTAPALLKIAFLSTGNSFESVNKQTDSLLLGDYECCLSAMSSFIQGVTHSYSSTDARTLLQKYLEYRFYHEIREKNIKTTKLENFINSLHTNNLIVDTAVITRLHAKREEYNVNSHTFDNESEEAKRLSIIELYHLLFCDLV